MEVDKENPSEITRLLANKTLIADLTRKRKLQAEHLGLPFTKHQYGNRSLLPKPQSTSDGSEVDDSSSCTSKFKAEGIALDDASGTSSAKDSNCFGSDDNAISSYNATSSSSGSIILDSSDARTIVTKDIEDQEMSSLGELDAENLEENLVDYESHIDYIYSGYGNYIMEQYPNKEIEEIPETSDANANNYILSSGRWTPDQETRQTVRKPTIDQEFEYYFSTLML